MNALPRNFIINIVEDDDNHWIMTTGLDDGVVYISKDYPNADVSFWITGNLFVGVRFYADNVNNNNVWFFYEGEEENHNLNNYNAKMIFNGNIVYQQNITLQDI